MYKIIGLAKEVESPENPGALEQRVALIPSDVKKLIDAGSTVFVEEDAGVGVGFSNDEYLHAGATIVSHEDLYANKDLIIKFKGPAMESIPKMKSESTLFCMAHFHSFPDRAKLLEHHQINVIAMENVVQSPEKLPKELVLGTMAADNCVEMDLRVAGIDQDQFHVIGYNTKMAGVIRRLMNHNPKNLVLHHVNGNIKDLGELNEQIRVVFDSTTIQDAPTLIKELKKHNVRYYDVNEFIIQHGDQALKYYRHVNPAPEFGKRKIEALHETGRAGARYGLELLATKSSKALNPEEATVTVLGYGNVGMGAIHECYNAGVKEIRVLGKHQTQPDRIEEFIQDADLIINGAEQPKHLRGKNYLITKKHTESLLEKGTVVIDLIGGSATNRSAVENVIECTYLTNPYFEEDGILFSALWGWPMMGFMRETAIKYSGQIVEILLGEDQLIRGINHLAPGVKKALVCGPFY
jgi:alanine dehydrogenase